MEIRLLKADEIECRVASVYENGVSLLLYKDARVDQKILDETFGMFGWQRHHEAIDGNLYCTVSVYEKVTGCWIGKQDVGVKGYTEQEKSQASDSFKRACFNWGIGRELYSAPFIWVPSDKCSIQKKGDRYFTKDRFKVSSIKYSKEREIISLVITNDKGNVVFTYTDKKKVENHQGISEEQIKELDSELKRTGVTMEDVSSRYEVGNNKSDISPEVYKRIMAALKKTKSAA